MAVPKPRRSARTHFAMLGLLCLFSLPQLAARTIPSPGHAEVEGWRTADGDRAPAAPHRAIRNGLAGWLLVTNDPDWEREWNTPAEHTPRFSEVDSLAIGEQVTLLVLISNARRDAVGDVDVVCDIRVRRADGTIAADEQSIPCLTGPLDGPAHQIALAAPRIEFLGEPGDPIGDWTFEVRVFDRHRFTRLDLKRVVTLHARP